MPGKFNQQNRPLMFQAISGSGQATSRSGHRIALKTTAINMSAHKSTKNADKSLR